MEGLLSSPYILHHCCDTTISVHLWTNNVFLFVFLCDWTGKAQHHFTHELRLNPAVLLHLSITPPVLFSVALFNLVAHPVVHVCRYIDEQSFVSANTNIPLVEKHSNCSFFFLSSYIKVFLKKILKHWIFFFLPFSERVRYNKFRQRKLIDLKH